jgi:very-short-patch-repair endonuclease
MERINWTPEKLRIEALECKTKAELRIKHPGARKAARKFCIWKEITSHMPDTANKGRVPHNKKWRSIEDVLPFSLQCKTKTEFYERFPKAYQGAKDLGVLELVCSHMPKDASVGKTPHNKKWTVDSIKKIAINLIDMGEFRKTNIGAYNAAWNMGILDEVQSHMKQSGSISKMEKELFDHIKSSFSSSKKIRDRKVKIEGKPYIKGFDIDIYVPELKLGIEFDGDYHHSFEVMRKSKNKKLWSDDDIRNYHEIKDAWFLTKGIKILHIKEKDWIKNKQACIDKCLEFLGG